MTIATEFRTGIPLVSMRELLEKACEVHGLTYAEGKNSHHRTTRCMTFPLDVALIQAFRSAGFVYEEQVDGRGDLADRNPQEEVPGYNPSKTWIFWAPRDGKTYPKELYLEFKLEAQLDGIVFRPLIYGSCVSPADQLPHSRAFAVLFEHAPLDEWTFAQKIRAGNGVMKEPLETMGFAGVLPIFDVFQKFMGTRKLSSLVNSQLNPFSPSPLTKGGRDAVVYVRREDQMALVLLWQRQLSDFVKGLI